MSIRRLGRVGVSALVLAAAACGSSSKKQEAPAVTSPTPPVTPVQRIRGNWTYYDVGQGLSQDIQDVSVDEGGDVDLSLIHI